MDTLYSSWPDRMDENRRKREAMIREREALYARTRDMLAGVRQ